MSKVERTIPCPVCEGRGAWYTSTGIVCSPKNAENDNAAMTCLWCKGVGFTVPFGLQGQASEYTTWRNGGGTIE